jgi:DNA-binding IclR family transcriptional regulator
MSVLDARSTRAPEQPRQGRVQSVDRAAALLRAVAAVAPLGAPVSDLAEACGLNRATAWRLLATLEDNGLVERDGSGTRYVLGLGVARLAASVGLDVLVRRAHPVLARLSEVTGETADLALLRPSGLTYVDEVVPGSVMSASWLGRGVPLHATSSGKAWLAWLPDSEVDDLLPQSLTHYTPTTITEPLALRRELEAIRQRGYGTCRGEFEARLYGVSAPVLAAGRPIAVISLWGPDDRIPESRFAELGDLVVAAADELAEVLAGIVP